MVVSASSLLSQYPLPPAQVGVEVATAMAAKSLQAQRQQGAAALELLDAAATSSPTAGDPLVARATGLGGLLDVTA